MMIWECMYTSSGSSDGEESACNAGDLGRFLGREDTPEKEMATHSRIFTRKIPCTEEPGGLQSMGSQRVMTEQLSMKHIHHRLELNMFAMFCERL